jgi:hypothetical protein
MGKNVSGLEEYLSSSACVSESPARKRPTATRGVTKTGIMAVSSDHTDNQRALGDIEETRAIFIVCPWLEGLLCGLFGGGAATGANWTAKVCFGPVIGRAAICSMAVGASLYPQAFTIPP